jgi:ribonuclease HI
MSLFANPQYRWRETYSVLFREADRPSAAALRKALEGLREGYRVTDVTTDSAGQVESMTVIAPADFAGMDLSFVSGDDVRDQIAELKMERKHATLSKKEQAKLQRLSECDARFDVFHFEQVVGDDPAEDDEYMDPGSLISMLKCLAQLCHGVGVDSITGALL